MQLWALHLAINQIAFIPQTLNRRICLNILSYAPTMWLTVQKISNVNRIIGSLDGFFTRSPIFLFTLAFIRFEIENKLIIKTGGLSIDWEALKKSQPVSIKKLMHAWVPFTIPKPGLPTLTSFFAFPNVHAPPAKCLATRA